MFHLLEFTMLFVMALLLLAVFADTLDSQFTLADKLMPPGLPIVAVTRKTPVITEVERQGRFIGPFPVLRGHTPPPLRVNHPRALFRPPPPLPPKPLFNHLDHLDNEVEVNPALKKLLKDFSMADLPLAGEGENMLPGFFAPEFNNRFTPDENAPIISVVSITPRIPTTRQTTTAFSNQLPLADPQEARPLFPPFGQQQVAPQSNQLLLADPQEARPLFPPFGPQQVAPQFTFQVQQTTTTAPVFLLSDPQEVWPLFPPFGQQQVAQQSNQLPLADPQVARPLFPPFGPQQVAPQFTFPVQQTTTTAPVFPLETSSQQFPSLVPDTLKRIFPSFSESNFGSQFPPFSPNPSNPTTSESINTAVTEPFIPNIDHEFHNSVNQEFQDQGNIELSNEFPPRFNNNPALDEDDFFHPHHISELQPPFEHTSQGIHSAGPNRRPPKHVRKPQPNGPLRKPNKNRGRFVPQNGRVPRQLQRRPQQQPLRGIGSNNGRRPPFDQRRQRGLAPPSGESFNEINIDISLADDIKLDHKPILSRQKRQTNNRRRTFNNKNHRRQQNVRKSQISSTLTGTKNIATLIIVSNPIGTRRIYKRLRPGLTNNRHQTDNVKNSKTNPLILTVSKDPTEQENSLRGNAKSSAINVNEYQKLSAAKETKGRESAGFFPNKPLPDIEFDFTDIHDKVPNGLPQSLSSFTKAQLNNSKGKGTKVLNSSKGSKGNTNSGNGGKGKKRKRQRLSILEAAIRKNLMRPKLIPHVTRNIQKGLGIIGNHVVKATGEALGAAVVAAGEGLEAVSGGDQGGYLDLNHGTRSISSGLKLTVPHDGHVTEHKFGLQLKVSSPPSGAGFALPEVSVDLETGVEKIPLKLGVKPPHAFLGPFTEVKNINDQENHQITQNRPHKPSFGHPPSSSFGSVKEFSDIHHLNGFTPDFSDFGSFIKPTFGSSFDIGHDGFHDSHEEFHDSHVEFHDSHEEFHDSHEEISYISEPNPEHHFDNQHHHHHNSPQSHYLPNHYHHSPQITHHHHSPHNPRPHLPPCRPTSPHPPPRPPGMAPIAVPGSFIPRPPIIPCQPLHRKPPPSRILSDHTSIHDSSMENKPHTGSYYRGLSEYNQDHLRNIQEIKTIIQNPNYPGDYFRNSPSVSPSDFNKPNNNYEQPSSQTQREKTNGFNIKGFNIDTAMIPFGDISGNVDSLRHSIVNDEHAFLRHNSPSVDVERRRMLNT